MNLYGEELTPEEAAMFSMFEKEGWSDEDSLAYIHVTVINSAYKRICLSGSMSLFLRMMEIRKFLEEKGIAVETPALILEDLEGYDSLSEKEKAAHQNKLFRDHCERIQKSDVLLIVNEPLNGIDGYIGASTFLEMGFAFALNKPIFLLNAVPDQPNRAEILGLSPIALRGKLEILKDALQ